MVKRRGGKFLTCKKKFLEEFSTNGTILAYGMRCVFGVQKCMPFNRARMAIRLDRMRRDWIGSIMDRNVIARDIRSENGRIQTMRGARLLTRAPLACLMCASLSA